MNKYTIILHKWWMDCKGWESYEVEVHDGDEAQRLAKAMCFDRSDHFQHCAFFILPKTS